MKKNQLENLQKLRILKKDLIHIQGIPKTFAVINLLRSEDFLGQYGTYVQRRLLLMH